MARRVSVDDVVQSGFSTMGLIELHDGFQYPTVAGPGFRGFFVAESGRAQQGRPKTPLLVDLVG